MRGAEEDSDLDLPKLEIDKIVMPINRFLHIQSASGIVLLSCALFALICANSPWADWYASIWQTEVGITWGDFEFRHSLKHLINDGLMAVFFFVIGLEVKREIVFGELGKWQSASLPISAAIGGMIAPAAIYFALQFGQPGARGWGIPMATDIAFVIGCMALLGSRVPQKLRVTVLSLAIVDDIGAILVIALGYTDNLDVTWLLWAGIGILVVRVMARIGIRRFPCYFVAGAAVWFAFHESGVHATIAGVILGLMTPAKALLDEGLFQEILRRAHQVFEGGGWKTLKHRGEQVRVFQYISREAISPLEYLENALHPWTSFVIMPLFALANANVPFEFSSVTEPIAIAVIAGLLIGKPVGIFLASWVAVKTKIASLPQGVSWFMLAAAGSLSGIGFTMAMFIAGLALNVDQLITAKVGVLVGSILSALLGMALLLLATKGRSSKDEEQQVEVPQQVDSPDAPRDTAT